MERNLRLSQPARRARVFETELQYCACRRKPECNNRESLVLFAGKTQQVVENDPVGLEFDGERQCLPLAVTQASAQQRCRWQDARRLYLQPGRENRNRRRDLMSDRRRNQDRSKNGG